ncbi:MAG: phosphoribosylglycinamide formyltransferase [Myxococcaceae bacterium]|nr:phosphoribosylglycinamide formyltransferase [Myxococcaceae bacterium]
MNGGEAKKRLGVLVSGSGSNLQALIDACAQPDYPAELAVVISNVPTAFALERARRANVSAVALDHKSFADREAFDAELVAALRAHRVDVVCLAGFMRLVGKSFLDAFPQRVLNIHPSLLPAFPGLHGPRQAVKHGAKVAGCTVHFVDAGLDSGPIIAQAAVPVLPEDTEETLAARILIQEHQLYPLAVRWLCEGRIEIRDRTVHVRGGAPAIDAHALRSPGGAR